MSARTKKPFINLRLQDERGRFYLIPKSVAEKYRAEASSVTAEAFFAPYEEKYGKPGMILRGLRLREGETQQSFAEKIGITQTNLSKMELGKRPIGKEMAKRIAKIYDIRYQSLL